MSERKLEMSENSNNDVSADSSNITQSGAIFKLNIDCIDMILNYLSLKDLHSFGRTCKAMNQVSGQYFKRNYQAATKYTENDGIQTEYSDIDGINRRIQSSGFNQFINYFSHYYERLAPLDYIDSHSHELLSIKHIYLVCARLDKDKIQRIQKLFGQIETLQIRNCSVRVDFYESILKLCKNMKQLYLQEADIRTFGSEWWLQEYPQLEYLELIPHHEDRVEHLVSFFQRNPNVQHFSTSSRCLLANATELLKCDRKFDTLEVKVFRIPRFHYDDDDDDEEISHLRSISQLLIQLHARGFYNRLHIYIKRINEQGCNQLNLLHGLEKLCIKYFGEATGLTQLTSLIELVILNDAKPAEMNILANSLPNLQRIYLQNATFNDLLPFIRHSMNLRVVKFFPKNQTGNVDSKLFKIITSEKYRKELRYARKITIYVPDHVYLSTIWRLNGITNLNCIEIKRTHSYLWDNHY